MVRRTVSNTRHSAGSGRFPATHRRPHQPLRAVFITGPDVKPGDLGDRSPFDLLPTAFDLVGCDSPWELSGQPFAVPTDRDQQRPHAPRQRGHSRAQRCGDDRRATRRTLRPSAGCHEIVIVDNGSTDDTLTIVDRFRDRIPNLRVVDGSALRGIAEVRNLAMAASVGDLLCCDADDIVAPTWVHTMTTALDRYDIVGGASTIPIEPPDGNRQDRTGRRLPAAWNYLPFCIGATRPSAGVAGRSRGWNLRYSTAAEDIDLCYHAQLAGTRSVRTRRRRVLPAPRSAGRFADSRHATPTPPPSCIVTFERSACPEARSADW